MSRVTPPPMISLVSFQSFAGEWCEFEVPLFTNNPFRHEFRCPLYRVYGHRHNHNTHTLTTYEQNEEYSTVTMNMNDLSVI